MVPRLRRPSELERRFATMLFTDIVGSTELAADLGDRRWRGLLARHHAVVRRVLRRYGGREVDTAGDGFFATFDQPARAVQCAAALVAALEQLGITIRAGLHAGEVERLGDRLGGIAVHIGSRVASTAAPAEVLISSTLREMLAGSEIRFDDRGRHRLKGVPGEWRLYAVDLGSVEAAAAVVEAPVAPEEPRARRPRTIALVGGAAALVVAAALAAVFLTQGGGAPSPVPGVDMVGRIDPDAMRFEGTPVAVGARPTGIVAGGGALWVTNYADRTISRIDPRRRAVTATPSIGGTPTGVVFGADSIWITTGFGLQSGAAGSIVRMNARDNQITKQIELGSGVQGIAFDGDSIWVANTILNTVTRVDPATNSPGRPVRVGERPQALAADERGVWVANTLARSVTHLSRRGRPVGTTPLRTEPTAVAVGERGLWVAASRSGATVTRLDPATGDIQATIPVAAAPNGITAGAGGVWVTMSGAVQRIDPRTNRVTATIPVHGDAHGVIIDRGAVWVTVRTP